MSKSGRPIFFSAFPFGTTRISRQLVWWHLALVIPTIGFKYLFVRRMSFTTGLETIVESMGGGIIGALRLVSLASIDVLEVSVIVLTLFVTFYLLLRIPIGRIIFATVFSALTIMGANQYSLLLVANLISVDTLAISSNWALEHPYILWQSFGFREIGFFALATVWAFIFARLASGVAKSREATPAYLACFKVIIVISCVGGIASWHMNQDFPLVLRGYWSSSTIAFLKLDRSRPETSNIPPLAQIQADYRHLAYPWGSDSDPKRLVTFPGSKLHPRHILIITLETAPRKFYSLIDNPALPTFFKMSRQSITSNQHFAMSPYTWWNNASILSGVYFVQKGKGIFDYGDFEPDSLPSLLAKRGYSTTFVESSKHGWGRTTGFWNNFGFDHLLDSDGDAVPFDRNSYMVTVQKERQSFARAWQAIAAAERRNQKAMVLLATTLGHYPWVATPESEAGNNVQSLHKIAKVFDGLLGELLDSIEKDGLLKQVLIVITGDHGFRMRTEFESVGLRAEHGDVAFNVPFLLYGPGLFDREIRLPYVTSHVDIAPTLLALLGIEETAWLHHGTNMLDQRLRYRATFMMNTNLSPISGFRLHDCHYTFNDLTGQVRAFASQWDMNSNSEQRSLCSADRLSDETVRNMLKTAEHQFQTSLSYFQQRASSRTQAADALH